MHQGNCQLNLTKKNKNWQNLKRQKIDKKTTICDVLRNLVPFVQFKKCEKTTEGVLVLVKLKAVSQM